MSSFSPGRYTRALSDSVTQDQVDICHLSHGASAGLTRDDVDQIPGHRPAGGFNRKLGGGYASRYPYDFTLRSRLPTGAETELAKMIVNGNGDWLVHYNTERPHLGYRNQGHRPIETVMSFVSEEG